MDPYIPERVHDHCARLCVQAGYKPSDSLQTYRVSAVCATRECRQCALKSMGVSHSAGHVPQRFGHEVSGT